MLFNSLPFALFFVALLPLLAIARNTGSRRAEMGLLIASSLFFYSMWHPAYLLLLLADVGVNFILLRWMVRLGMSRACLLLSVSFTLLLLGWFKYSAMAVETALPFLRGGLGLEVDLPDFFLPLGISFYSFQIVALAVDVYRGHLKEVPSFSRYLLFVAFFPQLIAGPIVRGKQLLPQLARGGVTSSARLRHGIWLISTGLFKKVVMGDFFLAAFVNEVFAAPSDVPGGGVHLIAMYSFAFQIYFDFAGYTDLARGLALLMGYDLPPNFREPYLSLNPAEFWRRWHITLSSWFRDYVYIPLSMKGRGGSRAYANLVIVFALTGLWHGAAWHFVVWGVYHGLFVAAHRLAGPLLNRIRPSQPALQALWIGVRWLVTFNLVAISLLLFRADSVSHAFDLLTRILTDSYEAGLPPLETLLVGFALAFHVAERWLRTHQGRIGEVLERTWWGCLLEGAAVGSVLLLAVAASGTGAEFIYFQF